MLGYIPKAIYERRRKAVRRPRSLGLFAGPTCRICQRCNADGGYTVCYLCRGIGILERDTRGDDAASTTKG